MCGLLNFFNGEAQQVFLGVIMLLDMGAGLLVPLPALWKQTTAPRAACIHGLRGQDKDLCNSCKLG